MQNDIGQKFNRLAEICCKECGHLSSIKEMILHPAYHQIISMGSDVVPYILEKLKQRPDHWFFALRTITGEDPVRQQSRGRVREMARDWLDWGRKRDLLRPEQSSSRKEASRMQYDQIVIAQAVRLLAFHVEQLRRNHDPEAVVEMGTVRDEMVQIIERICKEEGKEEKCQNTK